MEAEECEDHKALLGPLPADILRKQPTQIKKMMSNPMVCIVEKTEGDMPAHPKTLPTLWSNFFTLAPSFSAEARWKEHDHQLALAPARRSSVYKKGGRDCQD